jgi:signal transduction histidine kinase/CheY-like chemotaxis protein
MLHLLLIDDNQDDRALAIRELKQEFPELQVEEATDIEMFQHALDRGQFNCVITDYHLRWSDGLEVLRAVKSRYPHYPVVMFTDSGTQEMAVEAMKLGLDDYLIKSSKHFVRLPIAIRSALHRKRAEQRAKLLADTSHLLVSFLDARSVVTQVMQLVVPVFADWCFTDITGSNLTVFHTPIVVAADPAKADLVLELRRRFPPPSDADFGAPKVLRTGNPELVTEIPDALIPTIAQNEEHLSLLRQLQAKSYMIVPLIAQERKLGTIAFALARSGYHYTEDDLAMATELAQRVSLAIDNARLYQEAREANRVKDEFLAIVSHELRTPLNSILGWSQILRNQQLDEAATTRALEIIERNARLQNKLIDDILDISRIIQNKIHLDLRSVHLATAIHAAVEIVRAQAEAKQITIKLMLDPNVRQVDGDADRLQQIVWNLLSNAIKFTPTGGQIKVQLKQIERDVAESTGASIDKHPSTHPLIHSYAQITVSDTGQGIRPDFLPHVFDRFRQGNGSTTRSHNGLGLGLAIVRHLVEMHQGSIYAASEGEGKGATFTVQLPTRVAQPSVMAELNSPAPQNLHNLNGLRVLVCDDDADSLELITFILEECQVKVTQAASAATAFQLLSQNCPDILISDIGMPEEDGYSLMRRVRTLAAAKGWNLPAIALTAFAREEERAQALAAGFQLHLPKPIDPSDLIQSLIHLTQ